MTLKSMHLSPGEMKRLLPLLKRARVSEFEGLGLKIKFFAKGKKQVRGPKEIAPAPSFEDAPTQATSYEHAYIKSSAALPHDIDEQKSRDVLDELVIEDPLEYEKLVMEGLIVDGDKDSGEEL